MKISEAFHNASILTKPLQGEEFVYGHRRALYFMSIPAQFEKHATKIAYGE